MSTVKIPAVTGLILLGIALAACEGPRRPPPPVPPAPGDIIGRPVTPLPALEVNRLADAFGQSVYVPVYSQLVTMTARRFYSLTANVVVHNTDPDRPIMILSARYYGNGGTMLTEFLEEPKILLPFSSTTLLVEQLDREGGIGANFVIDWMSESRVSEPAIEAVMIGESGTQGVSFISPGRVIRDYSPTSGSEAGE